MRGHQEDMSLLPEPWVRQGKPKVSSRPGAWSLVV